MNLTPLFGHFNSIPLDQLAAFRGELIAAYSDTRAYTEVLSSPLTAEQQCVQSMPEASPVKWHRAHTSWFFETFILQNQVNSFEWFDSSFCYLFNSYYNAIGKQYPRAERGQMVQPDTTQIHLYRQAIDQSMLQLLTGVDDKTFKDIAPLLVLGMNHEQQHQELLLTDYQNAWSANPASPAPWPEACGSEQEVELEWLKYPGGLVKTGYTGSCFSFDSERPNHKFWLESFLLANRPAINAEYLAFIDDGGYENPLLWLADGWAWVQQNKIQNPVYWSNDGGTWKQCNCAGVKPLDPKQALVNINFYEASAFATWSAARLPTEHEWEHAMNTVAGHPVPHSGENPHVRLPRLSPLGESALWLGNTWEWTASPYVAYPRFQPPAGAVGEYNGKFMSNQIVLRGYSGFTSPGHSRTTYRNFFYPDARWQQSGVRLARDLQA